MYLGLHAISYKCEFIASKEMGVMLRKVQKYYCIK